jgi:hypothetical protein
MIHTIFLAYRMFRFWFFLLGSFIYSFQKMIILVGIRYDTIQIVSEIICEKKQCDLMGRNQVHI